jgi:hypothetical protein
MLHNKTWFQAVPVSALKGPRAGTQVCFGWHNRPIKAITWTTLPKLDAELDKIIATTDLDVRSAVYDMIASFIRSADRVKLMHLYEAKKLTLRVLFKNYFFEGFYKKDGTWFVSFGS